MNSAECIMEVPIIGISRHRLGVDGKGITSLVAFHGCTLHCRYCLNPQCLVPDSMCLMMTPDELCDELMIDDLYFQATGGGVCFGGGEPLLRSDFIREFRSLAPKCWHITVETSLQVTQKQLEEVFPCIDHYIVDIKDTSPDIYRRYTGGQVERALGHLQWLVNKGVAHRIVVRLPHIPDFNTDDDVKRSRLLLENMGITHFDEFNYIKNVKLSD